jgi:hypothetical protein
MKEICSSLTRCDPVAPSKNLKLVELLPIIEVGHDMDYKLGPAEQFKQSDWERKSNR